jgi:hypothetical protein
LCRHLDQGAPSMTLKLPTPDEVISTWFALEDEAESTPALIRKVCDQFANVISPGDGAMREIG